MSNECAFSPCCFIANVNLSFELSLNPYCEFAIRVKFNTPTPNPNQCEFNVNLPFELSLTPPLDPGSDVPANNRCLNLIKLH